MTGMAARKRSTTKEKSAPKNVRASLTEYRKKRDFDVTDEPSGNKTTARKGKALAFVIQKHAASHLHFDLRLEVDGVMKSWAVPKGPTVDPAVKRLAMEVEDHPMAYNTFEGTIPQGEYGGGTVMLWDRGTWTPDEVEGDENDNDAARRALKSGKLAFTFHGERLHGSYALVRTRRGEERAQWLLLKHKDKYAKSGRDIVEQVVTSVDTGRKMEEIAAGDNDELDSLESTGAIAPMLPTKGKLPLPAGEFAIEPQPDGDRVLVFLANGTVKLVDTGKSHSKHNDMLESAPKVQAALLRIARHRKGALVLDAFVDADELVVVDLLLSDDELLVDEPWIERRVQLEEVFADISALAHGA
ncbi:MAG: DNA polymerase ligase N-terminal domain-containing protein, partial [Gemmatimonadaceae bacterium]